MPSIPAKVLNDTITKNSYLILPRITSQVIIIVKRDSVYTNLTFFIMTIFRCRSLLTNCVLFIRRNFHYVSFQSSKIHCILKILIQKLFSVDLSKNTLNSIRQSHLCMCIKIINQDSRYRLKVIKYFFKSHGLKLYKPLNSFQGSFFLSLFKLQSYDPGLIIVKGRIVANFNLNRDLYEATEDSETIIQVTILVFDQKKKMYFFS